MSLPGVTPSCAGPGKTVGRSGIARPTAPSDPGADTGDGGGVPAPRQVAAAALGSLTIRRWELGNGLRVITAPDGGARAVSCATVYRVGSRDEDAAAGETGLAHLFEHLMFTGTGASGQVGDFDQRIEEVGGFGNAMTYYDFTSYIDEVPPAALDRVIRLEADRMINLNLGARQVANERDVVVQERLGTVEDSVDGALDEMVWQQAFRVHPYRWPIIGRMQDIKSIDRDRALAFYRRYYSPDRAVVVVAGRFDEAAVLRSIASAYRGVNGRGRPAPAARPAPDAERAPLGEVRSRIQRPVAADRMVVGFPAPALADADRPAFDVLNELVAGGPSSRLYRLLVVDRDIASSVSGDVAPTRDPGLWSLWTQMTKGHDARRAEEVIVGELSRVCRAPVGDAELAAAKNRLETAFWVELASSQGRAEALGHFEVSAGDFRVLLSRSAAYAQVTAADVERVARAYAGTGARSVVVASPGGPP